MYAVCRIDIFVEDLHKLVTKLKLHDFALVGFSMGAGEVARYLGKYGSNMRITLPLLIESLTKSMDQRPAVSAA